MPYKLTWDCIIQQTDAPFNPIGDANKTSGMQVIADGFAPTQGDLNAAGSLVGTAVAAFMGTIFPVIQSEEQGS